MSYFTHTTHKICNLRHATSLSNVTLCSVKIIAYFSNLKILKGLRTFFFFFSGTEDILFLFCFC